MLQKILLDGSDQTIDDLMQWIVSQHRWLFAFEEGLDGHCRQRYEDFVQNDIQPLQRYLAFPLTGEASVDQAHDHVPRTLSSGGSIPSLATMFSTADSHPASSISSIWFQ